MTRLAAACACLALLLFAAGAAVADEAARIEAGRAFAEANCARCHAVGPEGASPLAEAPPFRGFQLKWPLDHLAEALAEGIVVGHPEMPEFELDQDEIDALLAYLGSLPAE